MQFKMLPTSVQSLRAEEERPLVLLGFEVGTSYYEATELFIKHDPAQTGEQMGLKEPDAVCLEHKLYFAIG